MIPNSEIKAADPEEVILEYAGIVRKIANTYRRVLNYVQFVDYDDLIQAGYIGLLFAQKKYSEEAETPFLNYAPFFIRTQIRLVLGIDGRRDFQDLPLSLDAPISDDQGEGVTLGETIPAEVDIVGDYEAKEERQQIQEEVRAAVDRLRNDQHREVIKKHYLQGKPFSEVAIDLGCDINKVTIAKQTAFSKLRKDKALKRLVAPSFHVGIQTFRSTLTSVVEKEILWKEKEIDTKFGEGTYLDAGKPEPAEEEY